VVLVEVEVQLQMLVPDKVVIVEVAAVVVVLH
jgi:hypothetical protein